MNFAKFELIDEWSQHLNTCPINPVILIFSKFAMFSIRWTSRFFPFHIHEKQPWFNYWFSRNFGIIYYCSNTSESISMKIVLCIIFHWHLHKVFFNWNSRKFLLKNMINHMYCICTQKIAIIETEHTSTYLSRKFWTDVFGKIGWNAEKCLLTFLNSLLHSLLTLLK